MQQQWYFYIVQCRDGTYYCGITNNLEKRIKEHNKGAGAKYTSGRRPVKVVYQENCKNISEAMKREAQIKTWPRRKKEQLISEPPGLRSD